MRRFWAAALAVVLAAGLAVGLGGAPAAASPATGEPHDRLVSPDPADFTPQVLDGSVKSMVKIGNRIFVGGSFTSVRQKGANQPILTRNRAFAIDARTGVIDPNWAPNVGNDQVSVLLPAEDGLSVYIGGGFGSVNGVTKRRLARVDLNTGALINTFAPQLNGKVNDLRLAGGRLYAIGTFTQVQGVSRTGIAALDPATGARDDFSSVSLSGTHNGGNTSGYKMDVSPDGSQLVVVGNFNAAAGQTRRQIVMFDLTGPAVSLANWDTTRYGAKCASGFSTYMRDIDYSPDGSYFW
jgi:hypothetical protein